MNRLADLTAIFAGAFGQPPEIIARAPGRVNLIGEHTDYNDGYVLPVAIDRAVYIVARLRADGQVRLYAADFDQRDSFDLGDVIKASSFEETSSTRDSQHQRARSNLATTRGTHPTAGVPVWSHYVRGVIDVLSREGYALKGFEAIISGDVPRGAGLSSSAALEMATMTAFRSLNNLQIDPVHAALFCQRAENEYVGVRCGIMDQFISSLGRTGHSLLVDCRTLEHRLIRLPAGARVIVVDGGVRRKLVESAYNERRAQCEEGARLLGAPALRDISVETFTAKRTQLPPIIARRCDHVVTENQRVLDGVAALERQELATFGRLMNESHASLRDLFEVSTPEMDALVDIQQSISGCLGARLTGAGFGGSTVALVEYEAMAVFAEAVKEQYVARTGLAARVYVCHAADGAGIVGGQSRVN